MNATAPVLVVGGTGNLGGKVVDQLLERGKPVRALVRPSTDASRLEARGVEIVRGDMFDLESLARAMDGADADPQPGFVVRRPAADLRRERAGNPRADNEQRVWHRSGAPHHSGPVHGY